MSVDRAQRAAELACMDARALRVSLWRWSLYATRDGLTVVCEPATAGVAVVPAHEVPDGG